jgi:hypothetical protein
MSGGAAAASSAKKKGWPLPKTAWRLPRMDWRGHVIVSVTGVLVFLTVFVYLAGYCVIPWPWLDSKFEYWVDPLKEIGAVFAAWVGGLTLFVIAGAFVAIVSLERPEKNSFDQRARILFRHQHGKHINYIVTKIGEALEHYAETTTLTVTVRQFDETAGVFRVTYDSKFVVRSYIDDMPSTYTTTFALAELTPAPKGKEPNRLHFLRVNKKSVAPAQELAADYSCPVNCAMAPGESGLVHSQYEAWQKVDEAYEHTARRYTQALSIVFDNLLDRAIFIKYATIHPEEKTIDRAKLKVESVPAGDSERKVIQIEDLVPGPTAVVFFIQPTP